MTTHGSPIDHHALAADIREVCQRHGLVPPPEETVYGWVTLVGVVGHDPDGREYRRTVCVTAPGLTHVDVWNLVQDKVRMLMRPKGRRSRVAA